MNSTGVKLKLLHALFAGRYCISNHEGIKGSGIKTGVMEAEDPMVFKKLIRELIDTPFQHIQIEERREMSLLYDNMKNASALSELL